MIDASTLANIKSFAGQLPTLTEGTAQPDPAAVAAIYGLDAELPAYEPARLDMFARGVDPVLAGLPDAAEDVAKSLDDGGAADVAALVGRLADAVAGLGDLTRAARERGADPNALVDAAERYAWLHAAASCVHLWWANRDRSLYGTPPGSAGWLGATLGYLLARADGVDPRHHGDVLLPALDAVVALRETNQLFSAQPVRLATTR